MYGGHLKAMVYQVKRQNIDQVEEHIRDACVCVTPDELKRVHHEWERHICMHYQCNRALFTNKETIFPMSGDLRIAVWYIQFLSELGV